MGANFNTDDVITLGLTASAGISYTIKAETFDGLFATNQMFWLRETVGSTITYHDIRTTGYTFTPSATLSDNTSRFAIVFKSDLYTTQLNTANCNITLTDLNNSLFCGQISGATGYIFEVTEVANPANIRTITRTPNSFSFQMLPGITTLGTQYSVRVSPIVNGFSQGFGPACLITTQALPPPTMVNSSHCTTSSARWVTFYINQVNSIGGVTPTDYRVEVTSSLNPLNPSYLDLVHPASNFQLQSGFSPALTVAAGATYTIRVAYKWNNQWQAYGPACTHTKAATINRMADQTNEMVFDAIAYPNPFADNFKLNISTSSDEKVELTVYDMLGRLIESKLMMVSDIYNQQIGDDYGSGVYNLVVKQKENIETLRIVKR